MGLHPFDNACEIFSVSQGGYDGIGFVITPPYFGIDLDSCIYPSGKITGWATDVLDHCPSYCEVSPSGVGLKIIGIGDLPIPENHANGKPKRGKNFAGDKYNLEPACVNKKSEILIYRRKFFTVTGRVFGSYKDVNACPRLPDLFRSLVAIQPQRSDKAASEFNDESRKRMSAVMAAMQKILVPANENDGSQRLLSYARQAKRFLTNDGDALRAIRAMLTLLPAPTNWTDADIMQRYHEADVVAGSSFEDRTNGGNHHSHGDNPHNSREKEGYRHERKNDTPKTAIPEPHQFAPFPTAALPSAVAEFVRQTAKSICCDESFVALPILAGLASAIGNSHALRIKNGWNPPPILWAAVVSPSGTAKTAPLRQALRPIYSRQKRLLKDFDKAYEKFRKDHEIYEKDLSDFKKSRDTSKEPPKQPEEPACGRVVVDDTTIEALGKRLRDNPRGILLAKDELSTWFASFARYKSGSSTDEAKWLEFFGAQYSIIDRASSTRPIIIDRASVCISGTIQPAILKVHLTNERKSSGLAARLLFAMPPMRVKKWTEFEVSQRIEDDVNTIFDALFNLEMRVDSEGNLLPNFVRLETAAKERFVRYYNDHNREQQHLDGDLYAAYSKLEEYAARFALVIHCTECAANPSGRTLGLLTLDSMQRGIELCEWFKNEARRVYAVLSESDLVTENRQLIQWCSLQNEPVGNGCRAGSLFDCHFHP